AHGVLRVNSRICKAKQIDLNARYPIILPKSHAVTELIINDYHRRFGHANSETVVNEIRQRYYIQHLRSCVSRTMKNCQRCKIRKCQPSIPRMAPLPEARLTAHIRPFSAVGIDYLGPIEVVNARRREKRYVAVFTCLVTRALHLEVAHSLSTVACIMAIRRFVSRRGPPTEIFSDNGTNFVGANAHTTWRFNPPSAPHMGGVWERMEMVTIAPHPAEALRSSYRRATELTSHFWDSWLKEYVPTLHGRAKWQKEGEQLKVGALVFVTEGARKEWPRAVVEKVFPGCDGRVRQAMVRTAHGKMLKRPVVKLARIDAEIDREEEIDDAKVDSGNGEVQ
uniref:Integrase catalytic domain-containing protein n=1 Tax=Anopheles quadriannulatus TaxID=34691 RepID=A0A182XPY2_ANOQN